MSDTLTDAERQLVDVYLDGDFPEREYASLFQRLETEPEALAYLAARTQLDVDLRRSFKRRKLQQLAVAVAAKSTSQPSMKWVRPSGSLIRTSLLKRLNAATFIVSLRIAPESPLTLTILLTPDVGPGQIYWLISGLEKPSRGNGTVFIKTEDQPKNLRFASNRPLKRAELIQWHTLAVVHDPANKRVRHYLDGALLNEKPLDDSHPLKLRQLVIGNWGFTTEPRNFVGRMDELAVFKRAFSDEEIAKF